jgi:hypothetical protein
VMSDPTGPLLAIETKALSTELIDKNAAQLIQYCSVEGIEWAALTNGRELQFFNTFLKPDLAAKRILSLALLAYNNDAEFDALFEQFWQLSRESMTTPTGVRTWLKQRRLDTALRSILLNPSSPTIRQIRRVLSDVDVQATPQDLTQWFRSHLGSPITSIPRTSRGSSQEGGVAAPNKDKSRLHSDWGPTGDQQAVASDGDVLYRALTKAIDGRFPDTKWRTTKYYRAAECKGQTFLACRIRRNRLVLGLTLPDDVVDSRLSANNRQFNWNRITQILNVNSGQDLDERFLSLVARARLHAIEKRRRHRHFGVELDDLISAGYLSPGVSLILKAGSRDVAEATLTANGEVEWNGDVYRTLSDKAFAPLLGPSRISLNGWMHWYALLPDGVVCLAEIRDRYLRDQKIGHAE